MRWFAASLVALGEEPRNHLAVCSALLSILFSFAFAAVESSAYAEANFPSVQAGQVASSAQPVSYTTAALSGQIAPGTGGRTFESFSYVITNSPGEIAFKATLSGDVTSSKGLWAGSPGSLRLVAQSGSQAPGAPVGVHFADFIWPRLGEMGRVGFVGELAGSETNASNDRGVWLATPTGCDLVVREGNQAPGLPEGTYLDMSSSFGFGMNPDGRACIRSGLTGNGRQYWSDGGIWVGEPGNLQVVAYTGGPRQDPPGSTYYGSFGISSAMINRHGQIGFEDQAGSWIGAPDALSTVTFDGQQAPDLPAGVNWRRPVQLSLNDRGETAFWSFLSGGYDMGYFMGAPGDLHLVARKHQPLPGLPSGFTLAGGSSPKISPTGEVVMPMRLEGNGITSNSDDFLLRGDHNHLSVVAREGDRAPGTPSGVFLGGSFGFPSLNAAGQIAFWNYLSGAVDSSNDRGMWATDPNGVLTLVAREGDEIEVAPGDFRTVESLRFQGFSTGQDGHRRAFSDSRQVVFGAGFTDGSSGVFTATIPEPSTLVLLSIGAVGLLAYARRRRKGT